METRRDRRDLRILTLMKFRLRQWASTNNAVHDLGLKGSTLKGGYCHHRDRTYPYTPYPNLSTPIPSHLNHSQAPNAKPEPSDPLASQQRTPEHPDSLASSQRIPDPTVLQPFLSLTSSRLPTPTLIPNPTLLQPFLSLMSSRFPTPTLIPDPTHPRPLLFLASSRFPTSIPIPDPTL